MATTKSSKLAVLPANQPAKTHPQIFALLSVLKDASVSKDSSGMTKEIALESENASQNAEKTKNLRLVGHIARKLAGRRSQSASKAATRMCASARRGS